MKTFPTLKKYLEEKLVIAGGGKPYGQVIFLAGGQVLVNLLLFKIL